MYYIHTLHIMYILYAYMKLHTNLAGRPQWQRTVCQQLWCGLWTLTCFKSFGAMLRLHTPFHAWWEGNVTNIPGSQIEILCSFAVWRFANFRRFFLSQHDFCCRIISGNTVTYRCVRNSIGDSVPYNCTMVSEMTTSGLCNLLFRTLIETGDFVFKIILKKMWYLYPDSFCFCSKNNWFSGWSIRCIG